MCRVSRQASLRSLHRCSNFSPLSPLPLTVSDLLPSPGTSCWRLRWHVQEGPSSGILTDCCRWHPTFYPMRSNSHLPEEPFMFGYAAQTTLSSSSEAAL